MFNIRFSSVFSIYAILLDQGDFESFLEILLSSLCQISLNNIMLINVVVYYKIFKY